MKTYCPDCGTRMEYKAANKPNFCTNCGYKFAGAKVDPPSIVTPDTECPEEQEGEVDFNKYSGLDVHVDVSPNKGVTFGEALGTASAENGTEAGEVFKRPLDDSVSSKDVMQSFKREAGTDRPQPSKS